MTLLEFLGLAIAILLILILIKLYRQYPALDNMANQLLLRQLEKIEKTMDEKKEEDNKRQEGLMKCIEENISSFTRTIHGTKRRGKVGETLLGEMLSETIKAGFIVTDLDTDNGKVEFAWDMKNGKYLPIDSKMPEIEELYSKFDKIEDVNEQLKIKKEILGVVEKRQKEAKKYLNNHNTIDKCLVAVPDGIFDMFPDINKNAVKSGVFVTGYAKVFLFAAVLSEHYLKSLETGDLGIYRETIGVLRSILKEIGEKTNTINRGITQISGANKGIQIEVDKSMSKIGQIAESKIKKKVE